MKNLLELVELGNYNTLLNEVCQLAEDLTNNLNNIQTRNDSHNQTLMQSPKAPVNKQQRQMDNSTSKVTQFPIDDLNHKMGEALNRLEAAYKGLGLTNKLTNIHDKVKNRSRIMSNINKLRALLKNVEQQLAKENQEVMGNSPEMAGVSEGEVVDFKAPKRNKDAKKESKGEFDHIKGQIDSDEMRDRIVKSGGNFLDNRFHKMARHIKKKLSKMKEGVEFDVIEETVK